LEEFSIFYTQVENRLIPSLTEVTKPINKSLGTWGVVIYWICSLRREACMYIGRY